MWWIWQIVASICITIALSFSRWYVLNCPAQGIFIPWAIKVGAEFIVAYAFMKSYVEAPSFFQPWFVGAVLLSLFGFLSSLIFFGEAINLVKIFGAALSLIGAALLIL